MGKSKLKKYLDADVGSIGIGAMIVFIAMVLVAGIAASVLIQTSTKLETQAMRSGQETIDEVSTGIAVEDVTGYQFAATDGSLSFIAIEVRPRAGSSDIDLLETVIELSDSATKNYLTYVSLGANSSKFTDTEEIDGDIFTIANFTNSTSTFSIFILEDADSSASATNPVINRGDHVVLGVNVSQCFGGLAPRKDTTGMVITEAGAPGIIGFTTPASFTEKVVDLQ